MRRPIVRDRVRVRARRRRGAVHGGVVAAAAATAGITAAAIVVRPGLIGANEPDAIEGGPVTAREADHRAVATVLSGLIARCHGVLEVRDGGAEIVLWRDDATGPGRLEAGEVLVLRHAPALRTLFLHALEEGVPAANRPVPRAEASDPEFPDRLRRSRDATRTVLATGLSEIRLEPPGAHPVTGPGSPFEGRWRLSLTWRSESADARDEAVVLLDAARR